MFTFITTLKKLQKKRIPLNVNTLQERTSIKSVLKKEVGTVVSSLASMASSKARIPWSHGMLVYIPLMSIVTGTAPEGWGKYNYN